SRKRRKPQFGRHGKTIRSARRYGERIIASASTGKQDRHWRAILVENVRVDGKPTQRHVAYLAGFTESALAIPAQQYFLWQQIEEQLDRLHNRIPAKDRKQIEAVLIKKIGQPPTKAQRAMFERRRKELLESMASL